MRASRVVDEAVDAAESIDDARHERLRLSPVGDVGLEGLDLAADLSHPLDGPGGAVDGVVVMDGDHGALGGGLDRDLGADPATAAGHEHDPARERPGHQDAGRRRSPARPTAAGGAVESRTTTSVGRSSRSG